MTTVVVNILADRDINDIFETIRQARGSTAAASYNRSLDMFIVRLMSFPESGALRPALGPHVRIGIVRPYIVVYSFDAAKDVVEILRILHGRRDVTAKLLPL